MNRCTGAGRTAGLGGARYRGGVGGYRRGVFTGAEDIAMRHQLRQRLRPVLLHPAPGEEGVSRGSSRGSPPPLSVPAAPLRYRSYHGKFPPPARAMARRLARARERGVAWPRRRGLIGPGDRLGAWFAPWGCGQGRFGGEPGTSGCAHGFSGSGGLALPKAKWGLGREQRWELLKPSSGYAFSRLRGWRCPKQGGGCGSEGSVALGIAKVKFWGCSWGELGAGCC